MAITRMKITDEVRDNIALLLSHGVTCREAAKVIGCSRTCTEAVARIPKALADRNIESLLKDEAWGNHAYIEWACKRQNVNYEQLEKEMRLKLNEVRMGETTPDTGSPPNPEQENNPGLPETSGNYEDVLAAVEQLAVTMKEGFRRLENAINVNADIIVPLLNQQIDLLGGIKMNTKKKPHQP